MKLHSLACPQCAQWLSPQPDDIVLACPRCFSAVLLEDGGLRLLSVYYAASAVPKATWYPFWTFQGQVTFTVRETQSGNKAKDAEAFWQTARQFLLPAWALDIWAARTLGLDFLQKPPFITLLDEPIKTVFQPVTLPREDALKLADFIILTLEAERKDWLRDLQFTLQMDAPTLWLLPGEMKGNRWQLTI